MQEAEIRLQSIQSMLVAGQRSVHLERHTLLIWGLTGGLLCAMTESVLTSQWIPSSKLRALAVLMWLSFWLGSAALLDHGLTRRARRIRDETVPFAQAQITRAWWLLLGLGVLGSVAFFFYGGGLMIYAMWIVLLGMGTYLFGLFSRSLIEWIGIATILLGIAGLVSGLPLPTTRWLAASCFAIGLPLAGKLGLSTDGGGLAVRVAALGLWLVAVTVPALLISAAPSLASAPAASPVPISALHPGPGEQTVVLPAGTLVAIRLDLDSPLLSASPSAFLPITVDEPILLSLRDGQPDGRYRLPGQPWQSLGDGQLRLNIDHIQVRISGQSADLLVHAAFHATNPTLGLP
ncbi:hypothetical protein [Thiomonas delicata]|uniref:Putative Permease of the major facilitator superfamily n=1 Tax=Thiomonas delicata TaxID=364030 RepID=A0A238D1N6_THIDL|nr:hypothetical protein [Thiomonas delicata]SBP87162.1 putative Permease of the major facilitator superfamily [Thiomonas delicata]